MSNFNSVSHSSSISKSNASVPAPWSLDLRSWHFTWSDEARAMHDAASLGAFTLWQVLGFADPEDLPGLLELAAEGIRTGKPWETDLRITTASGVQKRMRVTAQSLPDANGQPRLLDGTIAVIDENALEHADGGSETRIAQLESALRDWEVFARAIPHELKSPMITIKGFAAVLHKHEHSVLSERGRHYLEAIGRTAEHAKSLSEAILILAPMSMQAMRRESVDLSSIAQKIIDRLRACDETRYVEVRIEPDMHVVGDPDLLRLLVGNLLNNAWKFTSQRPLARIDIRSVATGPHQTFCVSDNGVGFDMAHAGGLFSPLVRLHGAGEFAGSGLGLAIAQKAIQRHGGRIWAEASEGKGATFFFSMKARPEIPSGNA
jgi:signal transduction histidine kinase